MGKRVRLFTIDDDTEALLNKVPWGDKSKVVNEALRIHGGVAEKKIREEVDFSNSPNGSEDSLTSKNLSSEPPKPSDDPGLTILKSSQDSGWNTLVTTAATKNLKNSEEKP